MNIVNGLSPRKRWSPKELPRIQAYDKNNGMKDESNEGVDGAEA